MPIRRRHRVRRRSAQQVDADTAAQALAKALGATLKDARRGTGRSQRTVAVLAAMANGTISEAEQGRGDDFTLRTWSRLARATGTELRAYLTAASAADRPRDAVHLRVQESLLETALAGGWEGAAEIAIDDAARGSRSLDVALRRAVDDAPEVAVLEVVDWLEDVGAALRDWTRRLARVDQLATARLTRDDRDSRVPIPSRVPILPRVSGCWVLRATKRNRDLVRDHRLVFRSRFGGSGRDWLRALRTLAPMPSEPALLWVSVDGKRLWPARP